MIAVTGLGPALALLHEVIEQLPAMVLHDVHLVVGVLERVRGEVIPACERVGANRVLVGGELQFGIGHAAQDFLQLLGFFDNGVAVLDGPMVVRTDAGHGVISLFFTDALVHIDGQIIHHRAGQGLLALDLVAVDFFQRVDARGLEVVAQAKRVSHLVGDQLGDQRPNEPLRHTVECDLGFFWLGLRLVAALVILLAFLLGQLDVQLE